MSVVRWLALTVAAVFVLPTPTVAAPIYDFSDASVGGNVTSLGTSALLAGGITAYGYHYDSATQTWVASTLIARDETNDHGLGVCSPGENCNIGGRGAGDDNELSQLLQTEAILLERPDDTIWTSLWLSSLDEGGTGGSEEGTLYWGDTNIIATLLGGTGFSFAYPEFGTSVEGQLTLPGTFDPTARYVLFVPGDGTSTKGDNNDYLVWGASLDRAPEDETPVPEPASLLLLGSGLCLLARRSRRQ